MSTLSITKKIKGKFISDPRYMISGQNPTAKLKVYGTMKKLNYKSRVHGEYLTNMAFFRIFSDYFNILKQNRKIAKEHGISKISFFRHKNFLDDISLQTYNGETNIRFILDKNEYNFSFDKYRQGNQYYYAIVLTSEKILILNAKSIYDIILENAISISNLRGEYIEMKRSAFEWTINKLEKRNFDDIFLPEKLMEDLNLYINVANKKNRLMRYLMVGNPGTGKTESTLVLANLLKAKGVTIVKTPVDEFLKEKIQLAEALAPSILIFDDLDLSIGSRTSGGYSPKELQMFLDALDGTDKINKEVGIISTTNSSKLLDLAAQRPGRFEKILTFDSLTKQNIGNIILKSLKYNFEDNLNQNLFFNKKVVDLYYDSGVTGAWIYNSINMLKLKSEMIDFKITIKWVINELNIELNISDELLNKNHLAQKFSKSKKLLGFGGNGDGDGEEELAYEQIDDEMADGWMENEEVPKEEKCEAVISIRKDSNETESSPQ